MLAYVLRTWEMNWHLAEMGIYKWWKLVSCHPALTYVSQLLALVLQKCLSAGRQQDQESLASTWAEGYCWHQDSSQAHLSCSTVKVNMRFIYRGGKEKAIGSLGHPKYIVNIKICLLNSHTVLSVNIFQYHHEKQNIKNLKALITKRNYFVP